MRWVGHLFAGVLARAALSGLVLAGAMSLTATPGEAQTRRAFLVGNERYTDGHLSQLSRTVNDAKDLAKDLEEAGFDKKNIKVATDIRNKSAFDKEFDAFLKTVERGDIVLFFYSGHGFGVEAENNNYLLFTELRSPFTYTRTQLDERDRRNPDIVRLRIPSQLDNYQRNEIPQSGIATSEIERKLAERNPKTVIMILDACRSLVKTEPDANEQKIVKRGDGGSRMLTTRRPPPGFLVLYSASFGETAIESPTRTDTGRNSLFTEVLRTELLRPGQSLIELSERVKLMVRAIAQDYGQQQEPEIIHDAPDAYDFMLVGSIGRERFQMSADRCTGDKEDWDQIKPLRKRDLYERHRRRFDGCGTAELARREIAQLALTSDDPIEPPPTTNRSISDCDRLAAADLDLARPPEVPGVLFEKIAADEAVAACGKAVTDNPRVVRYLFNLGRAYQKQGSDPERSAEERTRALRSARLAYDDASKRGYVSALNNLAVLYDIGDGVEQSQQTVMDLLKRATEQGHPLAMYNLGIRYRYGIGVRRDLGQAYELFAKSAEAGFVSAMVELGDALTRGRGVRNPRRGIEWLQRAADAGSTRAKYLLGMSYYWGRQGDTAAATLPKDDDLALLWIGRMAESGDSSAQAILANFMQRGIGLTSPQPEIAERFWRLAAYGGSSSAQVSFADRLRRGFVLVKQEYGSREAIDLLERALSQGSAQAALALAQIKRFGELDQPKDQVGAMKLAYRAIELAVQSDAAPEWGEAFPEMSAAHLLVEMAKGNEAVDAGGRPLLTVDEVERLERFYGSVDPVSRQVKIRRLNVQLTCGRWYDRSRRQWVNDDDRTWRDFIWVWDWGRNESPTEFQFRSRERSTLCPYNDVLRRTMIDIFEQSKKSKVAFADLVDQKVKTAQGQTVENTEKPERRRRCRRGRRC
jgi:TPR repeat protein